MPRWKEGKLLWYWAFLMEFDVDPKIRGIVGQTFHIRVPFNCYGNPIPAHGPSGRFSTWMAAHAPGAEEYFPDWVCSAENRPTKYPGMIQDVRGVDAMMGGCCPETLNAELLGGEESQD